MEIKFDNVTHSYDFESTVLNNINVEIKKEKINALIGRTGSGKTTMIELINALIKPTIGKIYVDDFVIEDGVKIYHVNDMRLNIGLIFQFPEEQFFCSTVQKEIEFGMHYFKYKTDDQQKRIVDSLKMVGLNENYLDRSPFSLSHGEMRKVAIASILAFNPKLIILDEPTIGLDDESKENLMRLIKLLKLKYKKTIIIISHDLDMLYNVSDYFYVLDKGNLVLEGEKYEIFKNHKVFEDKHIKIPRIMEFSNQVMSRKGIKLDFTENIHDLAKEIMKNVR